MDIPPNIRSKKTCLTCVHWRDGISYCCEHPDYPNHRRSNVCDDWAAEHPAYMRKLAKD